MPQEQLHSSLVYHFEKTKKDFNTLMWFIENYSNEYPQHCQQLIDRFNNNSTLRKKFFDEISYGSYYNRRLHGPWNEVIEILLEKELPYMTESFHRLVAFCEKGPLSIRQHILKTIEESPKLDKSVKELAKKLRSQLPQEGNPEELKLFDCFGFEEFPDRQQERFWSLVYPSNYPPHIARDFLSLMEKYPNYQNKIANVINDSWDKERKRQFILRLFNEPDFLKNIADMKSQTAKNTILNCLVNSYTAVYCIKKSKERTTFFYEKFPEYIGALEQQYKKYKEKEDIEAKAYKEKIERYNQELKMAEKLTPFMWELGFLPQHPGPKLRPSTPSPLPIKKRKRSDESKELEQPAAKLPRCEDNASVAEAKGVSAGTASNYNASGSSLHRQVRPETEDLELASEFQGQSPRQCKH